MSKTREITTENTNRVVDRVYDLYKDWIDVNSYVYSLNELRYLTGTDIDNLIWFKTYDLISEESLSDTKTIEYDNNGYLTMTAIDIYADYIADMMEEFESFLSNLEEFDEVANWYWS